MMANAYWEQRAKLRQAYFDRSSDEVAGRIYSAYDSAIKQFESDIQTVFGNFQRFHNLTPDEAKKLLNTPADTRILDDLRARLPQVSNPLLRKELLARINAPAYAARITRLQATREAAYINMGRVADVQLKRVNEHLVGIAQEAYGQTLFGVHKDVGVMFQTAGMSFERAQEIQRQVWSGEHYSSRIWGNSKALAQLLTDAVQENIMAGKTSRQTFEALSNAATTGKLAANRLIRTETNYVAGQSEQATYADAGAEEYEFVAVLDMRTSTVCQDLDGKKFKVVDQQVGVNMHPMHPWCRSTTAPVFSWEDRSKMQRRARDPVTGENVLVPADMTYSEWENKLADTYGPERLALAKKMQVNLAKDKKQFSVYKAALGKKNLPVSIAKFQEMKYNKPEAYQGLKLSYRQELQGRWERGQIEKSHSRKDFKPFDHEADIPEWMLKQSDNWTAEQKASFRYYSSHEFSSINTSLRRETDSSSGIKQHIQNIAEGINASPVQENAVVWRGTYFSNIVQGQLLKTLPMGEWPGTVIYDKAFSSASVLAKDAFETELTLEIFVPPGSTGAYIAGVSEFPHEHEMLLQKGQKMVIIEAEMRGGKYHVKAHLKGGRDQ